MNEVARSKPQPRKANTIKPGLKYKSPSPVRGVHHHAIRRVWEQRDHALKLYRTSAYERVKIIRAGLPAKYVKVLTASMHMPIERFYRTTGLARPTVDRKIRFRWFGDWLEKPLPALDGKSPGELMDTVAVGRYVEGQGDMID